MTRPTMLLWMVALVLGGIILRADTLVLRDGRRVQGELIAVRDGVIEFEGQRGLFGRERQRFDRDDVVRIEFENDRGDRFQNDDRGRDRDDLGGGRPSGMRERDVTVDAARPWTDTGVSVRPGQTVYFAAAGRVRWGPGRQDGPAGERNSPRNAARPIPSRPAGSLIGRVGDTDEYFFIGDEPGPVRLRGGGRLFLGINDDFLQDNSGSFRVTVYY
ncbi:MAG TPA: hypothetical protein VM032_10630 [Vicinamibacterales bacterium]|nr:hypothetical protein [Vicinamibacterales bacterium]